MHSFYSIGILRFSSNCMSVHFLFTLKNLVLIRFQVKPVFQKVTKTVLWSRKSFWYEYKQFLSKNQHQPNKPLFRSKKNAHFCCIGKSAFYWHISFVEKFRELNESKSVNTFRIISVLSSYLSVLLFLLCSRCYCYSVKREF